MRAAAACALLALAVAGCASLEKTPPAGAGESFAGRLSVRVASEPPRSAAAAFELRGSPRAGQLDLTTPLGSVLARARWSPDEGVMLATPERKQAYADLDDLTRDVLGEALPVAALFDWLRGQPWSGAPSQPRVDPAGFEQLGWRVDLARFVPEGALEADRAGPPAVSVKVRLER